MREIKVIETNQNAHKHIIKRVAAYARVSTKQELQENVKVNTNSFKGEE